MVPTSGRWQAVSCERCDTDFAFRTERSTAPVFCPTCGAYQRCMLDAVRRERYALLLFLALVAVLFGLIIGGTELLAFPAVLFHGAGLALLLLGQVKMSRFDPNASADERRGIRQHRHVLVRSEYEQIRSSARARGASVVPLSWRRA